MCFKVPIWEHMDHRSQRERELLTDFKDCIIRQVGEEAESASITVGCAPLQFAEIRFSFEDTSLRANAKTNIPTSSPMILENGASSTEEFPNLPPGSPRPQRLLDINENL
ncbi:hypothetical protein NE237_004511 [Protea cynaroides]|uniref:Uncharacterized protein n=1 Tax=Protea cynaroides TaxID=273540 RepID=A0A9Q0QTN7_9MAGN|nr:hypothetical protein NE237_004511 [Protea cynaroides]